MSNVQPTHLLWLDLEMTGIDPENSKIIEVGAIITDWDLQEIASYEQIVFQEQSVVEASDEWVKQNMSDLLSKVPGGTPIPEVEEHILSLIKEHCPGEVYLAGNSIHQDRRFIRSEMPQLENKLHYRMLDVSAWKVVMAHKYGVEFTKKSTHRALEDIRGSISELEQYMALIKIQ